jgi:hypothetical protein
MRASAPNKREGHPLSTKIIKYNRNTNNKTKGTQADRRKTKSLKEIKCRQRSKNIRK